MAWSFNPFTGNLDLVGGGAVVFEGEVETFADLPETIGDPAVGASFLVRSSTGVWLVNRRQAGIWIRRNNTGVRATDWEYGGDYPVNSVNGQTGNVVLGASDVGAAAATHASTHHTGGTDALAAHQINGQTIFSTGTPTYSTDQTLGAARALQLTVSNTNASGINLTLPVQSDGTLNGDTYVIVGGGTVSGPITIRRINLFSPLIYQTLATITATGQQYRFRASGGQTGGWTLVPVDTHTHTASQITDFAQAAQDYTVVSTAQTLTVGAKVAADTTAGAFTLTLPATPANGDTVSILDYAGTFDTNNLTIARNGSNIESLAEDMDCNIEDAAFSLVYVGSTVGWKVVPYFGNKTNFASPDPIGSSVPNTGAFTSLTANALTANTVNASNGTLTASAPVLDLSQTWNNAAVRFYALKLNVTNTASEGRSAFMQFYLAGAEDIQLASDFIGRRQAVGNGQIFSGLNFNGQGVGRISISARGANVGYWGETFLWIAPAMGFGWSPVGTSPTSTGVGTGLFQDANNNLAQRNGTNPQTFRLYNTFTDASNYERGFMRWSSNRLEIGTEAAGTGSSRDITIVGNVAFNNNVSIVAGRVFGCNQINLNATSTAVLALGNDSVIRWSNTSAFPSLRRSGTTLRVRLADDSDFTAIQGKLTTETAYTAGAPTATGYLVLYDSNGTAYKVPAEAL